MTRDERIVVSDAYARTAHEEMPRTNLTQITMCRTRSDVNTAEEEERRKHDVREHEQNGVCVPLAMAMRNYD